VGPTLAAALAHFQGVAPQGEFTLVLGGAPPAAPLAWEPLALKQELEGLVAEGLSATDAARQLAQRTGHPKRDLYALLHSGKLE